MLRRVCDGRFCGVSLNALEMLLKKGANPDAPDEDGQNCVHHLVRCSWLGRVSRTEDAEVLRILIKAGADIHKVDHRGFSPSMVAIADDTWDGESFVWGWWAQTLCFCGFDASDVRRFKDEAVAALRAKGEAVSPCEKCECCRNRHEYDEFYDDGNNGEADITYQTWQAKGVQEVQECSLVKEGEQP